MLLGIGDIV